MGRLVKVAFAMMLLNSSLSMAREAYPHEDHVFNENQLSEEILDAGEEYKNYPHLLFDENGPQQDLVIDALGNNLSAKHRSKRKKSRYWRPYKSPYRSTKAKPKAKAKPAQSAESTTPEPETETETPKTVMLGKKKATFPVKGGAKIISVLGDGRSGGRRHQGVDLARKSGTPIVAAWGGRVVKAYYDPYGGWAVKIIHTNGKSTYYAHMLRRPEVSGYQAVKQGQRIGQVGMSGNARGTQPHLHFEVRNAGRVLNPLTYIGGKRGQYVGKTSSLKNI